ncbi:MAG TPA: hypothetical protein VK815_08040 [Candidatus Acidoferrales bacterium]|jgi:hypothetical protein|nr:hypothetical protein [Candidatus Acidoferrales bacterium]
MSVTYTTQIDDRYRPGALKGLVKPRERYEVEKISEHEIRFRRLVPAEPARPRIIKRNGRLLLSRGKVITQAEVEKALEDFP